MSKEEALTIAPGKIKTSKKKKQQTSETGTSVNSPGEPADHFDSIAIAVYGYYAKKKYTIVHISLGWTNRLEQYVEKADMKRLEKIFSNIIQEKRSSPTPKERKK